MSRIVIQTRADEYIGSGHIFRALNLAELLNLDKNHVMFIINKNNKNKELVRERGFNFLYEEGLNNEKDLEVFIKKQNVKLWIFDYFGINIKKIREIKSLGVRIILFDERNLKEKIRYASLVINTFVKENIYSKKVFQGYEYQILNKNVFKYHHSFSLESKRKKVLVFLGGSDTYNNTLKVAKSLANMILNKKEFIILFAIGLHYKFLKELKEFLKNVHYEYKIILYPKNVYKFMEKAYFMITNGGISLVEGLMIGVPILAIANEKHEEETIKYFERKKYLKFSGNSFTIGMKVKEIMQYLEENKFLLKNEDLLKIKNNNKIIKDKILELIPNGKN